MTAGKIKLFLKEQSRLLATVWSGIVTDNKQILTVRVISCVLKAVNRNTLILIYNTHIETEHVSI